MSARFVKSIFCDCGSDHASGGYRQGPAEVPPLAPISYRAKTDKSYRLKLVTA